MDSKDFVLKRTTVLLAIQDRREHLRRQIDQNRTAGFLGIPMSGWMQLVLSSAAAWGGRRGIPRWGLYSLLPLAWKLVRNRIAPAPKSPLLSRFLSLFSI